MALYLFADLCCLTCTVLEGQCKERVLEGVLQQEPHLGSQRTPCFSVPQVSRLVICYKGQSLLLGQAFLGKTDHEKEILRIKVDFHLVLNLGDHTHIQKTGWHY